MWKCKQCGYVGDSTNEDMECPHCLSPSIKKYNYCGFTTVEEIIKDHKGLKKDIKNWERQCDKIINKLFGKTLHNPEKLIDIREDIEQISQEMMVINS